MQGSEGAEFLEEEWAWEGKGEAYHRLQTAPDKDGDGSPLQDNFSISTPLTQLTPTILAEKVLTPGKRAD